MTERRERIRPVCGTVRDMMVDASRTDAGRAALAEVLRIMRSDEARAARRDDPAAPCNVDMGGGLTVHVKGRTTARTTLRLAPGVHLRSDTLSARRTALPQSVMMILPGMTLGAAIGTGRADLDDMVIRAVRQQGRTLCVVLEMEPHEVVLADLLESPV